MTAVQITPAPSPAPQRSDRSTFADRADARLTWEDAHLVPEMNAAVTQVNDNTLICEAGAQAAQVAIASSHFKGAWSTLTGALAVPASVFHNGAFWVLLSDVADVTAKVPGVAAEWKEAQTVSQLPWFTASGSIAKGGAAAINSDGTVSAPAITAAAAGASTAIATAYYGAICYAADQDKFVLAASDGTNVKARVGTLSGTTVAWDAISATIGAANFKLGICAVGGGKVVVVYAPASGVFAAVGTISGTTITFGTPVQITATASSSVYRYNITFDPDTGSVVVVYQNGAGNTFAIAGAVSGTTITFGTAVDVGAIGPVAHAVAMPGTGGKVFLAYTESSTYKARILSLVGTAITANAATTWGAVGTAQVPMRAAFDPVSRKLMVVGCATSGNVGVAAVASVALTEIAFGTSRTFSSGGITASAFAMDAHWDTSAGVPVVLYADAGNSGYGTMVSGSIASGVFVTESKSVFLSSALTDVGAAHHTTAKKSAVVYGTTTSYSIVTPYSTTARDFIGFAQTAVSNAESVQVAATQFVDANQTGLTVGRRYYIADNGAITLTQTDTFAGTSVGTTRIIVKG